MGVLFSIDIIFSVFVLHFSPPPYPLSLFDLNFHSQNTKTHRKTSCYNSEVGFSYSIRFSKYEKPETNFIRFLLRFQFYCIHQILLHPLTYNIFELYKPVTVTRHFTVRKEKNTTSILIYTLEQIVWFRWRGLVFCLLLSFLVYSSSSGVTYFMLCYEIYF